MSPAEASAATLAMPPTRCVWASGSAVGLALGTLGLPFVQAALGEAGLRVALVWDMVNTLAGAPRHVRSHALVEVTRGCGTCQGPT